MKKMVVLVSVAALFLLMSAVAMSDTSKSVKKISSLSPKTATGSKCNCPIYFEEKVVKINCGPASGYNKDNPSVYWCNIYGNKDDTEDDVEFSSCKGNDIRIFTTATVQSDPQKRVELGHIGGLSNPQEQDVLLISTCLKSK